MGVRPNCPPDDHRILQEATFFQVAHQRRARLIGLFRVLLDIALQGSMLIPNFMKQLNEPDISFYKSPCQQAIPSVAPFVRILNPIPLKHIPRF